MGKKKGEFEKRIEKLLDAEHVMSDEDALNFVGAKFGEDREMLQEIITVLKKAEKEFPKKHESEDWRGNKPPAEYDTVEIDKWKREWLISGKKV